MIDTNKLYKKLTEAPELHDIPTIYIVKVAVVMLRVVEDMLRGNKVEY